MERGGIAIMIEGKRKASVKKTESIGNNGGLANKEERRMGRLVGLRDHAQNYSGYGSQENWASRC